MTRLGAHAAVVGGSIAGLMAARVLSEFFEQVTIFERDQLEDRPVIHKSTPQGNHVHALLYGGEQIISEFFPGFGAELEQLGAIRWRAGRDAVWYRADGKSYSLTGSIREPRDLGFGGHVMSRGLLEYLLRKRTLELANVRLEQGAIVEALAHRDGSVTGLRVGPDGATREVPADLVIDAGGRGSRAPRWLGEMGFAPPEVTTIEVDFAYTSTRFRKPADAPQVEPIILFGAPPPNVRGGGLFEIENGVWHVSLAGRFGDYPPTDPDGFMEFARSLPSPALYELIRDAERIADISQHRFPSSILRHYERMPRFPARFLLVGDAICSFNPVYGQGMTSAGLQARVLQTLLRERAERSAALEDLASAYFARAADVIATPWTLAANFDFAYPQTRGERPPGMEQGARYFLALDALQVQDPEVQRLVVEVFQLMRPLSALWQPPLSNRVLALMQGNDA
ncbi:MAG TPA: hypothetical protein VFB15_06430 [Candidatus Binataceae bacterium]|nr:hypothetical protein [Candidatus Binataceae bacterium]